MCKYCWRGFIWMVRWPEELFGLRSQVYIRFSFEKWNTAAEDVKCCLDLFSFQSNNVNDKTRKFDDVLSHCNQIIDVYNTAYVKIFVFSVISNWAINSYVTCQNSRNQNWIFGLLWLIFQPWLVQIATRFTIVFSYYVARYFPTEE